MEKNESSLQEDTAKPQIIRLKCPGDRSEICKCLAIITFMGLNKNQNAAPNELLICLNYFLLVLLWGGWGRDMTVFFAFFFNIYFFISSCSVINDILIKHLIKKKTSYTCKYYAKSYACSA